MKIGIVGGGFTGLTAAYYLSREGHEVTIFEKESYLGGLTYGFKAPSWDWYLEGAYHHLFTNDTSILSLIEDLGISKTIIVKRPVTATLYNEKAYQLDSAMSLLSFPGLPLVDRVRTGMFIAFMKANPFWKPLEQYTAKELTLALGGAAGWKAIWEPLMVGKFGTYADTIAASWLWARIKKRTPSLAYIEGGFQTLINQLEKTIEERGGIIHKSTAIETIKMNQGKNHNSLFMIHYSNSKKQAFDKVLLTIPSPLAKKLLSTLNSLPAEALAKEGHISPLTSYFAKPLSIPHLSAQVLVLETKEPILKDTYWLNITDTSFPFLAVVAHTNYMDKKHYGGHHITYVGNYLPNDHEYLSWNKEKLLKHFEPYLKKLNPSLSSKLSPLNSYLFAGPFAQPVQQKNYSAKAPVFETPIPNLYLANMDSVYPWDRGTNYAVELGKKAAERLV